MKTVYPVKKFSLTYKGRPDVEYGLSIYLRILNLRTFEQIAKHDFSIKPLLTKGVYNWMSTNARNTPTWETFKELYGQHFTISENNEFRPCPGQQSLVTVMEEQERLVNAEKPRENNEPGSVYGDTPNNIKQQPISFADIFNKTAQPFEIDGKKYQPRLELIDVDKNNN